MDGQKDSLKGGQTIRAIKLPRCVPLEEKIGLAVRRAHVRIAEVMCRHLEPDGITPREYACLCIVAGLAKRCNQRRLAEILCVPENGIVRTVAALKQKGLLRRQRDGDDRRHWYLSLTPQADLVLRVATQHVLAAHEELQIGLTAEEWSQALRLLWTLAGVDSEEESAGLFAA